MCWSPRKSKTSSPTSKLCSPHQASEDRGLEFSDPVLVLRIAFSSYRKSLGCAACVPRNQDINSTETPTRDLARSNLRCVTILGRTLCGAIRLPRCFRALNSLPRKLLQNGVFERLRRAQTHDRLGLDFNGLAGLRVAAHTCLAVRFHGAAEVRDHKFSRRALALFYRELKE